MAAAWTASARIEGVPFHSAATKILRRAAIAAEPGAVGIRLPFTLRTADAAELRFVAAFAQGLFNLVRRHVALPQKLKQHGQAEKSA